MRALVVGAAFALGSLSCAALVSFDSYSEHAEDPLLDADAARVALYGARGTVEGLVDAGVALTFDGVHLTNVQNGPFVFAPSVADGHPWQLFAYAGGAFTCTSQPAMGIVAGSDVTGIEVRCASTDAALAELSIVRHDLDAERSGRFSPGFAPDTLAYSVSFDDPPSCDRLGSTVTVYVGARDPGATVTVAGERVGQHGHSSPILLRPVGRSLPVIDVDGIAADAVHSAQYPLTIEGSGFCGFAAP